MKRFLLLLMSFVFSIAIAQEEEVSDGLQSSTYNKWSVDLNGGLSRPTTPFEVGYYVENFSFFHIDLGARYIKNFEQYTNTEEGKKLIYAGPTLENVLA